MLDKSVVKRIAFQIGLTYELRLQDFAQAIYDLGVKDEKERCAVICEEGIPYHGGRSNGHTFTNPRLAEAIRKVT